MDLRPPLSALVLLCAVLLTSCGGGESDARDPAATTPPRPAAPQPQTRSRGPLAVPRRGSDVGDPASIKVIRLWSDALRRGDVELAASFWATPSRVQNGTPVLTLPTAAATRLFNRSLSCGSMLTSALGAPNGFTIAVFKLTRRPGADCGTGTGQRARTAIRVRNGKITEWYRLPDDPNAPLPAPDAPQPEPEPQAPAGPII
ncbi:MAG: hypothetical protein M3376_00985 [Actinomycetota bacterium]|nr:hypothetical protein [Actinomycetota bacterium]